MTTRRSLLVLVVLLLLASASSACTRPRTVLTEDEDPGPFLGPTAVVDQAAVRVERPSAGDTVGSPVEVAGVIAVAPGSMVAAQVRTREGDGPSRWLGNASLVVDESGRFSGAIDYVLDAEAGADADVPGIVEVLLVDPASGTVEERVEIEVNLRAGR